MSSSSTSPEPEKAPKKSKDKGKKKQKQPTAQVTEHGKDEGTNPNWAYEPPPNAVLLNHDVDPGQFDWDAIKNDEDVELWLIRVPESVKPKYLENLKFELPPSSKSARIGTLERKHISYDIWSVGDDDDQHVGGEEVKGLSCLLPRKRKHGKLYRAPKPIARHLVVSAQAVTPAADTLSKAVSDSAPEYKNPPRHTHPKELLKHRFIPYGSLIHDAAGADKPTTMDVDVTMESAAGEEEKHPAPQPKVEEGKKSKGKKRKGEEVASSSKKSKKAKTAT